MFDIGWSEMAIIMLLALIIIGPKDLPRVARTIGQWVRKARLLAREFQTSLEDMARETELDEVKKEIEKVGRTDLKKAVEETIDPKGELTKAFDISGGKGEETVGKTLNGGAEGEPDAASPAALAQPASPAKTGPAEATASPSGAAEKATAAKTTASQKTVAGKPAASNRKTTSKTTAAKTASGTTAGTKTAGTRARSAKKPAAPKKRSAKPAASSAKSGGGDVTPADEGGSGSAAMAAKSS